LIVSGSHKSVASVCMILSMSGTFVVGWRWLQTCNGFTEFLNRCLGISFVFFFVVFFEKIFSLIIEVKSKLLLLDLITMIWFFGFLSLGFLNLAILH
jgi:hypothetical protein